MSYLVVGDGRGGSVAGTVWEGSRFDSESSQDLELVGMEVDVDRGGIGAEFFGSFGADDD